jgi:hypothetical protein
MKAAGSYRNQDIQDEFRALCRKYDVEIDERYCWDWMLLAFSERMIGCV